MEDEDIFELAEMPSGEFFERILGDDLQKERSHAKEIQTLLIVKENLLGLVNPHLNKQQLKQRLKVQQPRQIFQDVRTLADDLVKLGALSPCDGETLETDLSMQIMLARQWVNIGILPARSAVYPLSLIMAHFIDDDHIQATLTAQGALRGLLHFANPVDATRPCFDSYGAWAFHSVFLFPEMRMAGNDSPQVKEVGRILADLGDSRQAILLLRYYESARRHFMQSGFREAGSALTEIVAKIHQWSPPRLQKVFANYYSGPSFS